MKLNNQKGFTLIELILVIAILGILAVVALPQFQSLTSEANNAARDGVVGAVRSGIQTAYAKNLMTGGTYPTHLDAITGAATAGAGGAAFFVNVLQQPGVTDSKWSKTADDVYVFTADGTTSTYTYDSTAGTFQ